MSNKWNKQPGLLKKPKVCISPPPLPQPSPPPCEASFTPALSNITPFDMVTSDLFADAPALPQGDPVDITWSANFQFQPQPITIQNRVTNLITFTSDGTTGTFTAKADAQWENGCKAHAEWEVNVNP